MIFITVGTQKPFDRLVRTVDQWASSQVECEVVAQIGETTYEPNNLLWKKKILLSDYNKYIKDADLVISHLGIGTILSCIKQNKPIIAMPRCEKYGEHRNNHQVDGVEIFSDYSNVAIAKSEYDLINILDNWDYHDIIKNYTFKAPEDCKKLLTYIKNFIDN